MKFVFQCSFSQFAFDTLLSLYSSFTVKYFLKNESPSSFLLANDFDDFDTSSPPNSKSTINTSLKHSKINKYKPNRESNLSGLKTKIPCKDHHKNLPFSPHVPFISTPQLFENNSSPPPNHNLHNNRPNNLSPRLFPLPPLSSPPYLHSCSCEDTIFDNPSNNSPIHNVWQSTKFLVGAF